MRFLIWILLFLYSFTALAQGERYNFRKVDIQNGLSHNQVNALLKGTDGFLWIGTMSGLNRYDGYSCRVFRAIHNDSSSLNDNNINALYELPDRKMWVATMGGPCIYNPDTEKFNQNSNSFLQTLGLPSGGIRRITKGNSNRYWFLYDNGDLYLYAGTDKKPTLFYPRKGATPSGRIISMEESKGGKLWLLGEDGLLQGYDLKSGKLVTAATPVQDKEHLPVNFYVDEDDDIWLWGYNSGVVFFHPAGNSVKIFKKSTASARLSADLVSQIIQDNRGLIWVATDHGGVTLIDKKNNFKTDYLLNIPDDTRSLSQNSINTIYKDSQGIIWLGTYKLGVNYLNNSIVQFPNFSRHQGANKGGLPYDDVNRFAEDKLGNLWIGTNGGGLIYFNRQNNTFKQYLHDPGNPNSLGSNVIVSLWIDHKDVLWIGTYLGGLNSYDGKKFTLYKSRAGDTTSLSDDKVWEIFEDKDQHLWIGMLNGGLDLLDRKTGRFEHYREGPLAPLSTRISAMIQDRQGNLWIGTDAGISSVRADGSNRKVYQHTNAPGSLTNNSVNCILEDSKGRIWVGSRDGLNLLNAQSGTFKLYTTSDGLPDNLVLNILEDNQHTLWISTPNGLCNVIPVEKNGAISLSVTNYDEANNLQSREFNKNAAFKTRAGEIIFGGPSGFNIINPEKIGKHSYASKPAIIGFEILNRSIRPGELVNNRVLLKQSLSQLQTIDLEYRENVFSIEFASLDFASGKIDKYAYMLKGFNPDWLYADGSQRRATYTNLNPGHYVFEVKALNRDGSWSPVKSLQINIRPPFWQTPLAYIIYALTGLGLFFLARKITLERLHMKFQVQQQRREAERAHAIDQLKTKFFTNVSHEFRTPLSLIIAPLDRIIKQTTNEEHKKQLNMVQRNARRLLNLVNQLLDFRKMEVQEIKLHPSVGDIIRFTKDISSSFADIAEKKKIQLSFSSAISSLEIYFDKDKVEKILLNLISNAFKYTPDNGKVDINLSYNEPSGNEEEGTVVFEIKDTGIGIPPGQHERVFERFFQSDVPESMVNQGTGIGLAITREFVRLHGGTITLKSEPDKGACFTVTLPARKMLVTPPLAVNPPIPPVEQEPEQEPKNNKKKLILIVEDNEDLRFYLKDNLKELYRVEEASNGQEGWAKAKLLLPDLVVSDIMMPLMDGVELAKKIRSEMLTAHIPIVLLTAMGSEEKQLEALSTGVNDYVTKPFTYEILASRIRNLLAQQKYLQKRFQTQIEVNPSEITITPVDEQFLKQALDIVERKIDDPVFSVEDLSREMCMSRVTLYRKVISLTGKSPLDFIRSIRLKRAANLLQKSGLSVAEIAYQVGFNDPKVFSRSFKEEFNATPTQYAASHKNKN